MKSWMWWVVGGVVLYFTRNTWLPWLGIGPGKLPEAGNTASKTKSNFYTRGGQTYTPKPGSVEGRPPPPAARAK